MGHQRSVLHFPDDPGKSLDEVFHPSVFLCQVGDQLHLLIVRQWNEGRRWRNDFGKHDHEMSFPLKAKPPNETWRQDQTRCSNFAAAETASRLPVAQQQAFDFISKPQRRPDADNVVSLIQDLVSRLERQLGPAKHGGHAEILEYRGVGQPH
jgi:hypothetical protein